jgi:UrcA family protein
MAKLTLILLAAPIALAGLAVPAAAQDQRSVIVHYDDLNLASPKGRERLETRVRVAVRQVCGTHMRPTLKEQASSRECVRVATQNSDERLASLFNGNGTALADRGPVIVAAP